MHEQILGRECLNIVLDPYRFYLDFLCSPDCTEMLLRCWLCVWDEYVATKRFPTKIRGWPHAAESLAEAKVNMVGKMPNELLHELGRLLKT